MRSSRPMGDGARSPISLSRDYSMPLTSSWTQLGQPIVSNGLPLTKIHHAAFDAQLIGIDPDCRIHVSDRLLEIHDGPFLELGLKGIVGQMIKLPRRSVDRPDRDRLAQRFEEFKKAA
jgi:putative restriction endonuclease